MTFPYPPYDIWGTVAHVALAIGLFTFIGLSLFMVWFMWAEARAEREHWESQATRKMKAVRR